MGYGCEGRDEVWGRDVPMCMSESGKREKVLFVGGCVCREEVVVYGEKGMSK